MRKSRFSVGTAVLTATLLAGTGLSACKQKPDHDEGDSLPREVVPVPIEPVAPPVTTEPSPAPTLAPETPPQPLGRNDATQELRST